MGGYWSAMFNTGVPFDPNFPSLPVFGGEDFSNSITRAESGHATRGDRERLSDPSNFKNSEVRGYLQRQAQAEQSQSRYQKWLVEQTRAERKQELSEQRFLFDQQKFAATQEQKLYAEERQGVMSSFDRFEKLLERAQTGPEKNAVLGYIDAWSKGQSPRFQPLIQAQINSGPTGFQKKLRDFELLDPEPAAPQDIKRSIEVEASKDMPGEKGRMSSDDEYKYEMLDYTKEKSQWDYRLQRYLGNSAVEKPWFAAFADMVTYRSKDDKWSTVTRDTFNGLFKPEEQRALELNDGFVFPDGTATITEVVNGQSITYQKAQHVITEEMSYRPISSEPTKGSKTPKRPQKLNDFIFSFADGDTTHPLVNWIYNEREAHDGRMGFNKLQYQMKQQDPEWTLNTLINKLSKTHGIKNNAENNDQLTNLAHAALIDSHIKGRLNELFPEWNIAFPAGDMGFWDYIEGNKETLSVTYRGRGQ